MTDGIGVGYHSHLNRYWYRTCTWNSVPVPNSTFSRYFTLFVITKCHFSCKKTSQVQHFVIYLEHFTHHTKYNPSLPPSPLPEQSLQTPACHSLSPAEVQCCLFKHQSSPVTPAYACLCTVKLWLVSR